MASVAVRSVASRISSCIFRCRITSCSAFSAFFFRSSSSTLSLAISSMVGGGFPATVSLISWRRVATMSLSFNRRRCSNRSKRACKLCGASSACCARSGGLKSSRIFGTSSCGSMPSSAHASRVRGVSLTRERPPGSASARSFISSSEISASLAASASATVLKPARLSATVLVSASAVPSIDFVAGVR